MDISKIFQDGAKTGSLPGEAVDELRKALEAGYGTDVAALTGAGALRVQSLESTMLATIQENEHFRLFNALQKTNATATVDEWTEQDKVGGFLGGSTNSETGTIRNAQGSYKRRAAFVKFLMTRREVSFVATLGNNIVEAESAEYQAGALQLLTDAEYLSFEGDSDVVPTEFDGVFKQLVDNASDNVIDAEGNALDGISLPAKAAALIAKYGNFGKPTHFFSSLSVQQDLDVGLDPAFRVPLTSVPGGGIELGSPVAGLRTSQGNIATMPDVFVRDEELQKPFEIDNASIATANVAYKPAAVAGVAAADASSKFAAGHAGNYYYAVAGITAAGQTAVTKSAVVAVAAGDKVTLTIDKSASGTETGYVVYRSRKNGTNATSDFREMARIPYSGGATTTYVDLNRDIPGSTKAFVLNMTPGAKAITWRQFLPMMKFPLYPTSAAVVPWAQLLFGYLRLGKSKHHAVIKNIVTNSQTWKPFA